MSTFSDPKNHVWKLSLTVGLIEDIKERIGVDLDTVLSNPESIGDLLLSDPKKLVSIFYIICEDEINERKLTPKDFAKIFDRETIDKATDGLLEAILDFYPRASAGKALKGKLPALLRKMDDKITATVSENLEKELAKL